MAETPATSTPKPAEETSETPPTLPPELFAQIAEELVETLEEPAPPTVLELALASKDTYRAVLPVLLATICTSGANKKNTYNVGGDYVRHIRDFLIFPLEATNFNEDLLSVLPCEGSDGQVSKQGYLLPRCIRDEKMLAQFLQDSQGVDKFKFIKYLMLPPFLADGEVSLKPYLELLKKCTQLAYLSVPIRDKDELRQLSTLDLSTVEFLCVKLGPNFESSFKKKKTTTTKEEKEEPELALSLPKLEMLRINGQKPDPNFLKTIRTPEPLDKQVSIQFFASEDGYADAYGKLYPEWVKLVLANEPTKNVKIGQIQNFGENFTDPYQGDGDAAVRWFEKKTGGKWDYVETFDDAGMSDDEFLQEYLREEYGDFDDEDLSEEEMMAFLAG